MQMLFIMMIDNISRIFCELKITFIKTKFTSNDFQIIDVSVLTEIKLIKSEIKCLQMLKSNLDHFLLLNSLSIIVRNSSALL